MSEDIVTLLHRMARTNRWNAALCIAAADEIERLRDIIRGEMGIAAEDVGVPMRKLP